LTTFSLKGHTDVIDCVAFSPDGQRIATSGRDRTVKIWEAATPQQVTAWQNESLSALDLPFVENRPDDKAH
jgi:WD40 repeat protein